jgi:hypothetical protein
MPVYSIHRGLDNHTNHPEVQVQINCGGFGNLPVACFALALAPEQVHVLEQAKSTIR